MTQFVVGNAAIVKGKPDAVESNGGDRMVLVGNGIADDHEFNVLGRNAGSRKRQIFRDRIVLAIATARRESFKRRAPVIGLDRSSP